MQTYLSIWFHSDGSKPNEITKRLLGLGFRPVKGQYDFVYDWSKNANVDDIIRFADKVHLTLKGTQALFRLETI